VRFLVGSLYAKVTHQYGWLLRLAEQAFEASSGDLVIDQTFFLNLPAGRYPSDETINVVKEALLEVGTLRRDGAKLTLDRQAFRDSQSYRKGIEDAITALLPPTDQSVQLCATIPHGLDGLVEKALRIHTLDLRSALLDLIASAESRLVLASPFWDLQTAGELAEALAKRLTAGIRVDLLGRFPSDNREIELFLLKRLRRYDQCQLFAWHERNDAKRITTFHFKAAVIDDGVRAYLGTANLTYGGLRSVMELGWIVQGDPAKQLLGILNVILSIALPISEPQD